MIGGAPYGTPDGEAPPYNFFERWGKFCPTTLRGPVLELVRQGLGPASDLIDVPVSSLRGYSPYEVQRDMEAVEYWRDECLKRGSP